MSRSVAATWLPICLTLGLSLNHCVLSHRESGDISVTHQPKIALLHAAQLFGSGIALPKDQIQSELSDAKDQANSNELRLIKVYAQVIQTLKAQNDVSAADYLNLQKSNTELAQLYPADFEIQLTTALAADFFDTELSTKSGAFSADSQDSSADIGSGTGASVLHPAQLKRAVALVNRFPSQSLAHAHLAEVQSTEEGGELKSMRSYVRCMQLDPNNGSCLHSFELLAKAYETPRCNKYQASKINLFKAYAQVPTFKKAVLRKLSLGDQILFVEPNAAMDGNLVESIRTTPVLASSEVTVDIQFGMKGAKQLSALTAQLAVNQDFLAIALDGRIVIAARVLSVIDAGLVSFVSKQFDLMTICEKPMHVSLPADLADLVHKK